MECENSFKDLAITYLGKQIKSKYKNVLYDILIVDNNIKPGYLYDYGSVKPDLLASLIQEMHDLKMINNKLNVVIIGSDNIIINPTNTLKTFEEAKYLIECVDVSENLQKPFLKDFSLVKSIKEIIINSGLSMDSIKEVVIPESACNVTSLFGVLLGYPVIYWFNTENGKSDNCLSMEPLRVVEVRGHIRNQKQDSSLKYHQIYSFSIPECVLPNLTTDIFEWFGNLKESNEWTRLFRKIELVESTVTLPVVSM